jgi:putative ATPase
MYEKLSHSLNSALLSRCRVVVLNKLPPDSVRRILERALQSKGVGVRERGAGKGSTGICIDADAVDYLSNICDGDARHACYDHNCWFLSQKDARKNERKHVIII